MLIRGTTLGAFPSNMPHPRKWTVAAASIIIKTRSSAPIKKAITDFAARSNISMESKA